MQHKLDEWHLAAKEIGLTVFKCMAKSYFSLVSEESFELEDSADLGALLQLYNRKEQDTGC